MPQRRGRRSAGNEVAALAQRLSDDLLVLEEDCFTAIGGEFTAGVSSAGAAYEVAWRRAKDDPQRVAADVRLLDDLTELHAQVLAGTRPYVAALGAKVRDLALESIEKELGVCEETLAKKYVGVATEACTNVWDRSEGLVTRRLADYEDALQAGQETFARLAREQMLYTAMRREDRDRGARRLFNPEPNRMVGNGGRGVWWRSTAGLNRSAREVSIRLASVVRLAAMEEFNAAGAAR